MEKQLTQKLMAIVVLLVLCVSGHAQTKKVIIEKYDFTGWSGSSVYMTPKDLSFDNVPSPYVYSLGDDGFKFTIYDDNFGVKKIMAPKVSTVSYYTVIKALEPVQVVSMETEYCHENQETTWNPETGSEVKEFTAESAEKYITEQRGYTVREKKETSEAVFFYLSNDYYYYRYEVYAYQYPQYYYRLDKSTSYLYECNDDYREKNSYSVAWTEKREDYTQNITPLRIDIMQQDNNAHLTQTLFNTDAAYEYLLPVYSVETVAEYDGATGYDEVKGKEMVIEKISGTMLRMSGVKVVDDTGATVATFTFDSNFSLSNSSPDVFDLGGKKYIAFSGYIQKSAGESVSAMVIYSIDSETSAVRQVAMETGMRVNPTIAHRSDMITVSLEGDSNKVRKVRVVNAAGKTVKVVNVPAGQRSIQLHANELSNGLNIVNVEGEAANTCKVIVR